MLRRCIRDLSHLRSAGKIPRLPQLPLIISSSRELSTVPNNPSKRGATQKTVSQETTQISAAQDETSQSGSSTPMLLLGGIVVGAAGIAAYQAGLINPQVNNGKSSAVAEQNVVKLTEETKSLADQLVDDNPTTVEVQHIPDDKIVPDVAGNSSASDAENLKEGSEVNNTVVSDTENLKEGSEANTAFVSDLQPHVESPNVVKEIEEGSVSQEIQADEAVIVEKTVTVGNNDLEQDKVGKAYASLESGTAEIAHKEDLKEKLGTETGTHQSLAESYSLLGEGQTEGYEKSSVDVTKKEEISPAEPVLTENEVHSQSLNDKNYATKTHNNEQVFLDLIEAIHAAERKQAEADALIYSEEKRKLKEKYEKELKDARARELMYAEEAALLEKELNKEKVKYASALKTLQEQAEQKLREELKHKDEEADRKVDKIQELAKGELAAAIAREKAAQIESIADANLNIDALCLAFYARSEEARQSYSVHKLALGTLALEEALSRGLPIRVEVEALRTSLEVIDNDSLLELALSSLPKEVLDYGTDTQMLLKLKFSSLKGTVRHYSLIPAGGGGILTHAVAHLASSMKMDVDESGDSVESLIARVDKFLASGELRAAADALEGGLKGSEAWEVVAEWVRKARARAIAEQTLSILQSYATSITFT